MHDAGPLSSNGFLSYFRDVFDLVVMDITILRG